MRLIIFRAIPAFRKPVSSSLPVAGGNTNKEVAARLFISEATVKTHLLHIYAKLGVSDLAAAVGEAFNRGLLRPEPPT